MFPEPIFLIDAKEALKVDNQKKLVDESSAISEPQTSRFLIDARERLKVEPEMLSIVPDYEEPIVDRPVRENVVDQEPVPVYDGEDEMLDESPEQDVLPLVAPKDTLKDIHPDQNEKIVDIEEVPEENDEKPVMGLEMVFYEDQFGELLEPEQYEKPIYEHGRLVEPENGVCVREFVCVRES